MRTEYIAEWIKVHLSQDITVKQFADQFEMNPNYLTRLFRQEQRISVKEYILFKR
ncbi:helix-turn-helix transcriptional regulator [Niallia sp. JL1B1071]|uniref:helix-turn-helix transcriptional regulator n=1 Tax=Niallia tiangongensis TaxID=3237105 RepID=UPI0037DC1E08